MNSALPSVRNLRAKPRMFVIGASGFLGSHAVRVMSDDFEVVRGGRAVSDALDTEVDITQPTSVKAAFDAVKPEVVLLLAAMSDIDRCEQFPQKARAINVHGTENVVNACANQGAKLLFVSSSAVFDGQRHGYSEDSPTSPISVYGTTKVEAERLVLSLGVSGIVVRVALVIGFAEKFGTNSMLDGFVKRWEAGETISLPSYEHRNPIDAGTCSQFMKALLKNSEIHGIFHVGSRDSISRYELGVKLASRLGYPELVRPLREPIPGRAPRGPDHFLLTDKLRARCVVSIPTNEEAIERCLSGVAQSQV